MRGIAVTLALILVAGVLLDPYTLRLNASDVILTPPMWQLVLGLADVALLGAVGLLSWRRQFRRAGSLLTIEVIFALSAAMVLIGRDGLGRFTHGIAAAQYASLYLSWIGLRVLLLATLYRAAWAEHSRTS
jgi:hypothetical protein